MKNLKFNFISHNVKGLQINKKRFKVFENFKRKPSSDDMLFLQETHFYSSANKRTKGF